MIEWIKKLIFGTETAPLLESPYIEFDYIEVERHCKCGFTTVYYIVGDRVNKKIFECKRCKERSEELEVE